METPSNRLVSIIMPFKDTARFLPDTLDSILSQTYKDWELLAVDDGSTDESLSVVQKYAKQDPRIKTFSNKGFGIIPALQTGYAKCSGNFITRMDSDDIMVETKLEQMVDSLTDSGPGHLSVGLVKYFSGEGISNGYQKYEAWLNELTSIGANFSDLYKECVIPSPCWMAHREDFENAGGFDNDIYPEDYDLSFRFYANGLKIVPCQKIMHHWRDYPERTSRNHVHYAMNYFLDIKMRYFLKLDHDRSRPLAIWGAGFKGKTIAKMLVDQKQDFHWICDNPKKIGKKIYGTTLHHFDELANLKNPQSIVTVANLEAQKEIKDYFLSKGKKPMSDYFFFC